jgi:hypothetical protein
MPVKPIPSDCLGQRIARLRIADLAPPCTVVPRAPTRSHTMNIQSAAGALLIILPLAFNLFLLFFFFFFFFFSR